MQVTWMDGAAGVMIVIHASGKTWLFDLWVQESQTGGQIARLKGEDGHSFRKWRVPNA